MSKYAEAATDMTTKKSQTKHKKLIFHFLFFLCTSETLQDESHEATTNKIRILTYISTFFEMFQNSKSRGFI